MFARLTAWLFGPAREPSPKTCAPALPGAVTDARAAAYARVRDAESRGDDRGLGQARRALIQATHDELVGEVWGQ